MRAYPIVAAVVAIAIVGCGPADDQAALGDADPAPIETEAEQPAVMDHDVATSEFTALGDTEVGGTVVVDASGGQPVVTVTLRTSGAGVHQGHIHGGTCAERTGALMPLEPVTTNELGSGESRTTVDIPASTLRDGQHIVVFHEAGGAPGASIACAPIPTTM